VAANPNSIFAQADSALDENFNYSLVELAKNKMVLESTSGPEPLATYAATDWPVNKKGYKHKIYSKVLKDQRGYLEHEMLFKLPQLSVIREI